MGLHHIRELQAKLQLGQPDGHLIGAELAMGQLDVQQPVIQIGGLRAFAVEQEFLFRLLAQQPVLDAVLVVDQLQLLDAGKPCARQRRSKGEQAQFSQLNRLKIYQPADRWQTIFAD